jgi:hypothetical protein
MYTVAGAHLSGEGEKKGRVRVGLYGDIALLSADYFSVPENEISRIESLLTIVGGKVVYGTENYEGADEPLDAIEPDWSPVVRFGGYQNVASGARQAEWLMEAAQDSFAQRQWREDEGLLRPIREMGMPGTSTDVLGGCSDI